VDVSGLFGRGADRIAAVSGALYRRVGPWFGYRGRPPECTPSVSLQASVDAGGEDPPVYAKACADGGGDIRLVNNRGYAWEFPIPDNARIARTSGRGFSETVWDEINKGYRSGWALLPGGGSVTIRGVASGERIHLQRELATLRTDALLFVLTRGRSSTLTEVTSALEAVQCAASAANRASEDDVREQVRLVLGDCGGLVDTLPEGGDPPDRPPPRTRFEWIKRQAENLGRQGATYARRAASYASLVISSTQLVGAIADAATDDTKRLAVSIGEADQVIRVDGQGHPTAVGSFDITGGDKYVSDAIADFGPPASKSGTGADDCDFAWSNPKLSIHAATFSAAPGGERCDPKVELVQQISIRAPEFRTEAGARVGMTVDELQRVEPQASTRFTGQLYDEPSAATVDSVYRLAEIDSPLGETGKLVTVAALVAGNRVVALEVTPLLGGD
jgi:hypothetical protein